MKRFLVLYGVWFAIIFTSATVAAWWYKHVEEIDANELASRLRDNGDH